MTNRTTIRINKGRTMAKYCTNCGTKNDDSAKFCSKCGNKLEFHESTETKSNSDFKKIIGLLLVIIAVLIMGIVIFTGGSSNIPLENHNFAGISMLVPQGSNFVETSSLPNYGNIGGFIIFENGGEYSYEICSVMFSTIAGGSPPPQVTLDRTEGDISIYKDASGENLKYMERQVGSYKISIIGRNENTMIDMLNSVNINNPPLNI